MRKLHEMKPTVHLMKGGTPDKFKLFTDDSYNLVNHDFTNLSDYSEKEIFDLCSKNEYIVSAKEEDILYANELKNSYSNIILPRSFTGDIIDYKGFVPKNSDIYDQLQYNPVIKYAPFVTITQKQLKNIAEMSDAVSEVAIKTSIGSHSRGVMLVTQNQDKLELGGKYISDIGSSVIYQEFLKFIKQNKCEIIVQNLIPFIEHNLNKVNVDFIIRDGKLLGYKWTKIEKDKIYNILNTGTHICNDYTDMVMSHIVTLLTNYGVSDAMMNFEAFSNHVDETWLIEFNWRYTNSMFEAQAANIDFIGCYLNNKPFRFPRGEHQFCRYWQCEYFENNPNYINGK